MNSPSSHRTSSIFGIGVTVITMLLTSTMLSTCGWSTRRAFVHTDDGQTQTIGECELGVFLVHERSHGKLWECAVFFSIQPRPKSGLCDFGIDSVEVTAADRPLPEGSIYKTLTPRASPISELPEFYAPTVEIPKGASAVDVRLYLTIQNETGTPEVFYKDFRLREHKRKEPYVGE